MLGADIPVLRGNVCHRFDDVLDPKDVYSLLGLTAFYNGFFGQCSKAFTRLESLSTIEEVRNSRKVQHIELAHTCASALSQVSSSLSGTWYTTDPGIA